MYERPGKSLARDEDGAVMIVGLFMSLGLIGFAWFMIGVGKTLLFRERAQEAADSVAMTAAILHARGMNIVAALNIFLLSLVYAFMVTRLIEAIMYHLLQVVGLPANGFGNSPDIQPFELAGRTCNQLAATGTGSHAPELPTTVDTTSLNGLLWDGWACASKGRFANYMTTTGLAALPANTPDRLVAVHNFMRSWNIAVEAGNLPIVDAITAAQSEIAHKTPATAKAYAGFMAGDFDSSTFGGLLPNMKIYRGGSTASESVTEGKLPVKVDADYPAGGGVGGIFAGLFGGGKNLGSLCVRDLPIAAGMLVNYNGLVMTADRLYSQPANAGAVVANGQNFLSFFKNAVSTSTAAKNFWCDPIRGGAVGGANYWTARHYAGFVRPEARNGSDAFQVWGFVDSQLTDVSAKQRSIPMGVVSGNDTANGGYVAQAEYFYNCNDTWQSAQCNGISLGGLGLGGALDAFTDFALFRTAWYARLKRVKAAPAGISADGAAAAAFLGAGPGANMAH